MRVVQKIELTAEDMTALTAWARGRKIPVCMPERTRIQLLADESKQHISIVSELSITPNKAARWRKHFLAKGLADLEKDGPRQGRTRAISKAISSTRTMNAPKPFIWTASSKDILAKVMRGRATLHNLHSV